jgi:sugar O-acyltransferase (sialic acid O-acetyltransferase NeuD family)
MTRLAILGASGHGKVVADTAVLCGWEEIVFFDDAWPAKKQNSHWKIAGNSCDLLSDINAFIGVVVAIGSNHVRDLKLIMLVDRGARLGTIIHPSAVVSRYAKIGNGSVVFANVVVNADTIIGDAAILNTACTVDHDCILGNAVHISPGANLSGGVSVGNRSWIGIGACVKQGIEIGTDVIVGAGSVVVKNIPHNVVAKGNPAMFT